MINDRSALRLEPELDPVGSDGRDPHSYTERGVELRFTTEMEYDPYDDWVWCRATGVGDTEPPTGSINAYVMIKHPDGTSAELRADHENDDTVRVRPTRPVTFTFCDVCDVPSQRFSRGSQVGGQMV